MRLFVFLVAALAIVATEALVKKDDRCEVPNDLELKQRIVIQLISKINKPIPPDYRDSKGVLEQHQLKGLGHLPRHEIFSLFDQSNWDETIHVIQLLLDAVNFDDFMERSEVLRMKVNEELFYYAFSVALLHREDTRGIHVPRVHYVFPDKFLKEPIINKLKRLTAAPAGNIAPIVDLSEDDTGSTLDRNWAVTHFTEDIGMNSHHYHWHTVNPAVWQESFGEIKDRKGELFAYMHWQMINRMDAEYLSEHLPRLKPLNNWDDEIEEGYDPHLTILKTKYHYAYRPPHYKMKDLPNLPKTKLAEWSVRLFNCIHRGRMIATNGTEVVLDPEHGLDIVANAVESNGDSVNPDFYGNIHSYAHVLAGKITDPTGAYGEDSGVMYDTATAARDPLFYRWHKFISFFFREHKEMLPPYTREELEFDDVLVKGVSVHGQGSTPNRINTYYQDTLLKVHQGFLFTKNSHAYVKYTHIQHEDFEYLIDVENKGGAKKAVVRIFLAPYYNELGRKLTPNEQRRTVIEMDKFSVKLTPGKNSIRRSCANSSVTASSRSIFGSPKDLLLEDHCRCGWPDYLLVPSGTYEGMKFQVFVVLTDYDEDKVTDGHGQCYCRDAVSYCGGIDAKYPDKRAMGFPFDRRVKVLDWRDFKTDNMGSTKIIIKFHDDYLPPRDFLHKKY